MSFAIQLVTACGVACIMSWFAYKFGKAQGYVESFAFFQEKMAAYAETFKKMKSNDDNREERGVDQEAID